jgi:hypothetical protein
VPLILRPPELQGHGERRIRHVAPERCASRIVHRYECVQCLPYRNHEEKLAHSGVD